MPDGEDEEWRRRQMGRGGKVQWGEKSVIGFGGKKKGVHSVLLLLVVWRQMPLCPQGEEKEGGSFAFLIRS